MLNADITFCSNQKCKLFKKCGRGERSDIETRKFLSFAHFEPDSFGNCSYFLEIKYRIKL